MIKNVIYILLGIYMLFFITSCQNNEVTIENYNSVVQNLGWYESKNPNLFLRASGKYNENFWGDKFQVNAEIINKAKIASYKDVKLRVNYYSKTNSLIRNQDYMVYEIIPAQRTTTVKLTIDNYKDVDKIGWEVIGAKMDSRN